MTEPCAADRLCRGRSRGTPGCAETGPLCQPCLAAGHRAAGQLHLDYLELDEYLPRFPSQALDGQPGGSGVAPAIPIRVDVEALQRTIWWVTTTWAEILAEREQLAPLSKRTRPTWAVAWATRIITPRISALAMVGPQELADYPLSDLDEAIRHRQVVLTELDGARAVLDLIQLHDHARSWLGLTERIKHLPGRCQQKHCSRDELRQAEGSDTVYCDHCGHRMPYSDYERYGNVFLRGAA